MILLNIVALLPTCVLRGCNYVVAHAMTPPFINAKMMQRYALLAKHYAMEVVMILRNLFVWIQEYFVLRTVILIIAMECVTTLISTIALRTLFLWLFATQS